ncbi:inactive serine/threonine-protein kinase VRK3 isoform X1 [Chelonia mydas]|uniref:inactive serine/threonine-protein kinase VRK3 isoform X1 n=2 Tax=Chelonia mydas TaxID=8469 RepID=UPI0018A23FDD|nr:inactive serine/threonine-protein kinase VRK3 isoform X1 [Chelonia mydas]XP_037765919.1 inactive serine/threonine-protein kinase VRK3 isoform X1 [Chelonia mydas]
MGRRGRGGRRLPLLVGTGPAGAGRRAIPAARPGPAAAAHRGVPRPGRPSPWRRGEASCPARKRGAHGMINFCPQCGQKVETAFHFCPVCGNKLPKEEDEEPMQLTPDASLSSLKALRQDEPNPARETVEWMSSEKMLASTSTEEEAWSPPAASPSTKVASKAKVSPRSPRRLKSTSVAPLPEGKILTDQNSKQWKLGKLLNQSECGLMYEAQSASGACPQRQRYSLKLDTKDGRLYNEQIFLQRAAKKITVDKWKRMHSVPLLGIPNCVGFGLHESNYRFLVFPELGRTLQSILNDGTNLLTEKPVFQIAIRVLDSLEYIHGNEYVHGDITAENIYVNPDDLAEVTLAGYCSAFRYCPGGKHVAQREGRRTPHEGTIEFISLDGHRGAGPSRRSDLQSLGYCMVKWLCGFLPWTDELADVHKVMEQKERYKTDVVGLLRLCFGRKPAPDALHSYLQQAMALTFEEEPDYKALRKFLGKPLEMRRTSAYDSVDLKVVP